MAVVVVDDWWVFDWMSAVIVASRLVWSLRALVQVGSAQDFVDEVIDVAAVGAAATADTFCATPVEPDPGA